MKVLDVSHLSVFHGTRTVVKDISFTLKGGQLCALLGANGGGKTTLMNGLCCLLPHDGTAQVMGQTLDNLRPRQRAQQVSYIPQKPSVHLAISALEVVLMGFSPWLRLFENPSQQQRQCAYDALHQVGLDHLANQSFPTLSEGQKQLVIFARALVQDTPLMLLDEPDSALDFANRHKMLPLIQSALGQNKAGLVSLHDPNLALRYCHRALLLQDGQLIDDVDLTLASTATLETAFSKLYGTISIITHNNRPYLVEGN